MLENGPAGGGRESGLVGNLTFLELFPIVVALEIWGERLGGRAICFHCDNMSVVRAINSLFASSPPPPSFGFVKAAGFAVLEAECMG